VKPPRVKGAPIAFECKLWKTFDLPATVPGGKPGYTIVLGYIQGIYIDDAYIKDGYVQTAAMQPIARLGYMDYAVINDANMFTIQRPVVADDGSISVPENPK
jgi:flavin reductase (DIM6/NTAB) family NADH-FMN oxidoreductase RutF